MPISCVCLYSKNCSIFAWIFTAKQHCHWWVNTEHYCLGGRLSDAWKKSPMFDLSIDLPSIQILLVVKAWPVSLPLITGFHPPDPRSWHRVREQRGDSSAAPRSTGGCCVCFVFQFPIDSNSTVPRLHLLPPASCHSHKQSLVGDKTLVFPLPDSLCPMSKCPLIMSKFI